MAEDLRPSELLRTLMRQHADIRSLLEGCERLAGAGASDELDRCMFELAATVEAHNRVEERLLPRALGEADAFGDERIDRMVKSHRAEHAAMVASLRSPRQVRAGPGFISALAGELRRHMDTEERLFLNARVLRDDVVAIDGFGG